MKVYYTVTLAILAGAGLATVVQSLHAQAKPPVYHIIEIDVSNADGYVKEFLPLVQASVKSAGGRQLAVGGPAGARMNAIEGPLPQSRVSVQVWDIPRSRHNPKILGVDDAEIVGDRITEVSPIPRNCFTQETERRIGKLGASRVALVVRDMLVHHAP